METTATPFAEFFHYTIKPNSLTFSQSLNHQQWPYKVFNATLKPRLNRTDQSGVERTRIIYQRLLPERSSSVIHIERTLKMSRMFGLLYPIKLTTHESSTSLSELEQVAALKEALTGLDALLNDDLDGNALS